jgi:hypothetical protein
MSTTIRRTLIGFTAGVAVLIPAASAYAAPTTAVAGTPGLNAACQTVERKVYSDFRELVTIDLDTASDIEVRLLANQLMAAARAESLTVLLGRLQQRLDGTASDLRAFLKTGVLSAWTIDLRLKVNQSMASGGANVKVAAQAVLDNGTVDVFLEYLNNGLYVAREVHRTRSRRAGPPQNGSLTKG